MTVPVKELWKSVIIGGSYDENFLVHNSILHDINSMWREIDEEWNQTELTVFFTVALH